MTRVLGVVLAFVLVASACNGSSPSGNAAAPEDGPPVRVRDFRLVEASGGRRQVMGTLQNTTSKAIANAQVQVSLFDTDNVRVATMNVIVSDIPASGTVQFNEPLTTEKNVQGARVRSVLVM